MQYILSIIYLLVIVMFIGVYVAERCFPDKEGRTFENDVKNLIAGIRSWSFLRGNAPIILFAMTVSVLGIMLIFTYSFFSILIIRGGVVNKWFLLNVLLMAATVIFVGFFLLKKGIIKFKKKDGVIMNDF